MVRSVMDERSEKNLHRRAEALPAAFANLGGSRLACDQALPSTFTRGGAREDAWHMSDHLLSSFCHALARKSGSKDGKRGRGAMAQHQDIMGVAVGECGTRIARQLRRVRIAHSFASPASMIEQRASCVYGVEGLINVDRTWPYSSRLQLSPSGLQTELYRDPAGSPAL